MPQAICTEQERLRKEERLEKSSSVFYPQMNFLVSKIYSLILFFLDIHHMSMHECCIYNFMLLFPTANDQTHLPRLTHTLKHQVPLRSLLLLKARLYSAASISTYCERRESAECNGCHLPTWNRRELEMPCTPSFVFIPADMIAQT